jgi:hypothetical protein
MSRAVIRAATLMTIALAGAMWSGAANASTINYTFDVTRLFGSDIGTGTLTVDGTHGFDVTALDITVDGVTFDFSGAALQDASAFIKNGNLVSLDAFDITKQGSIGLFGSVGLFSAFGSPGDDRNNPVFFTLTDVADPPPAPAPLPSTWPTLLTGLIAIGFFAFRPKKKALAPAFAA